MEVKNEELTGYTEVITWTVLAREIDRLANSISQIDSAHEHHQKIVLDLNCRLLAHELCVCILLGVYVAPFLWPYLIRLF